MFNKPLCFSAISSITHYSLYSGSIYFFSNKLSSTRNSFRAEYYPPPQAFKTVTARSSSYNCIRSQPPRVKPPQFYNRFRAISFGLPKSWLSSETRESKTNKRVRHASRYLFGGTKHETIPCAFWGEKRWREFDPSAVNAASLRTFYTPARSWRRLCCPGDGRIVHSFPIIGVKARCSPRFT